MRVREEEEENKTKLGYFGFNLLKFLFLKKNTYLISILLNTNSIMAYIDVAI